jgi:hypothetical protein
MTKLITEKRSFSRERIIMTRKEIEQIALLGKLKRKQIHQEISADLFNVNTLQVRNKSKAYHLE